MSRLTFLVLALSLGLAFTLGLLFKSAPDVPGETYHGHIRAARAAAEDLDALGGPSKVYARIAQRLRPSVVSIYGEAPGNKHSSGSGVILDKVGNILTNLHVIEGMRSIVVTLSSHERYRAEIVGTDPPTDLAVLSIEAGEELHPVVFGDSEELLVGEEALAVGNALGFGWTVSKGIISSLHRSSLQIEGGDRVGRYQDFIQTDAAVNPGNSGGPLVNTRGEVIGINSLIVSGETSGGPIGFAIPSRDAVFVARQVINNERGTVHRGFLGIDGVNVRELPRSKRRRHEIPVMHGVRISYVKGGSPAYHAGLRDGDVILEMDGIRISDYQELRSRVARTAVESEVEFLVLRQGAEQVIKAVLSKKTAS